MPTCIIPPTETRRVRVNWNRREFLKLVATSAAAAGIGIGVAGCDDNPAPSASTKSATPEPLSQAELDDVVALSIALFEPEDAAERQELDTTMRWWATGRTTKGPHIDVYRSGLAALKKATPGKKIADLTAAERAALFAPFAKAQDTDPLKALTTDIIEGIYSSAVGWKSLGYTTWPGVPSAPLEYTTKPHGPTRVTGTVA